MDNASIEQANVVPDQNHSPTATSGQTVSGRIPQTPQEWESKRRIITKLYLEDGLKLKDVQSILENRYGFRAT